MFPRLGAAVVALVVAAGCGSSSPPPPPDPPQVSITVPSGSVVDTQVSFSVTVSGCSTVSGVAILDHGAQISSVGYSGNPTQGTLTPDLIPFSTDGVAANLALSARVTCSDGRTNTSQPIAVSFLPVAQLITNASGNQVVPDIFYAEGSGSTVSFVGCSQNSSGTTTLVRVDVNGNVVASTQNMPFACSDSSVFTDHISGDSTDTRWMLEPNVGAMAFDSTLQVKGFALGQYGTIGVGPDGDAIVYDTSGTTSPLPLQRLSAANGGIVWDYQPLGTVIGAPVVNAAGGVLLAEGVVDMSNNTEDLWVEVVPYVCDPNVNSYCGSISPPQNEASSNYDLARVNYGFLSTPPNINAQFSNDGSVVYLPYPTQTGSTVLACPSTVTGCSPQAFSASVTSAVELAYPMAPTTNLVAAVAPQLTWFLNSTNGQIVNPGGMPIAASGQLVTSSIQAGQSTDFYILNGSGSGLPVEVVAVDNPTLGEVFRYDSPSGTMTVGIDDSGQAWMRIGANLAQLLPLSQYRALLQ